LRDREMQGVEDAQGQVAHSYQQRKSRDCVIIGERLDMKMAGPDVVFERPTHRARVLP
jgi:hypothetical protein